MRDSINLTRLPTYDVELPEYDVGSWSSSASLRREDLYDEQNVNTEGDIVKTIYTNQTFKNPIIDTLTTIGMWMLLVAGLLLVISVSGV